MVDGVSEDISQDNIVKRYNALKCALPEKWTQTIQTKIYTRTEKIVIDINVNMNSKLVDFKMCTSKQLYWLVIEKMCQLPKSIEKWIDIFQTDESIICSMWKGVNIFN
jgi:hypothetical protein